MRHKRQRSRLWLGLACLVPAAASADSAPDYALQVKPLLARRCYSCHGRLQQLGGLRLDTGALVRKGTLHGPILVPGKAASSRLIQRVTAEKPPVRMPPEGEALKPQEIAVLRAWIDAGAPSPAGEKPETDPRKHWAFLRPVRAPLPKVKNAAWARNPIDLFVLAEQEKRGLKPAPAAPREVLLRRVYLDLTGLPPTREALHAFLADPSQGAYEKVVDRLLASPQYGERWGRHWMDVWRYSDWYGRRIQNDVRNSYGQLWRWRDWIVDSLNDDKGYDRMVQEMLAADEIAPGDEKAEVATGFLVRNWYSLNYSQWMRDNVEHTSKVYLGLTLNCAHCHDHKYDPLTQKEYFRFRAFFEPLELRHDRWPGDTDPGPFKKYVYGGSTAALKSGMIRVFDEKLDAKTFVYQRGDERNRTEGEPPVEPGAPAIVGGDRIKITPVALPPQSYYPAVKPFIQQEELARYEKSLAVARAANPADPPRIAVAEAELTALRARIDADNARYGVTQGNATELSLAASRAERVAKLRAAEAATVTAAKALQAARGKAATPAALRQAEAEAAAKQAAVEAAIKAVETADGTYTPLSPLYPQTSTGRRRALAEWIASRENPLTARVAVNHIWLRHFGRPLVDSVFDFGRNGKLPSHPALLDWLACALQDRGASPVIDGAMERQRERGKASAGRGVFLSPSRRPPVSPSITGEGAASTYGFNWSMKKLHRLLVTSSTYRMDSRPDASNAAKDRDNRYLWRYNARRVEAEVVRDSLLSAAGTLDLTRGGPELDNTQENTRRRSLYYSVYAEDGGAMRFLTTFDAPDTCDAYKRTESVVPQQALAMVNSRLTLDQGRLLARKLWEETASAPGEREAAFITAAFEQLLTRRPKATELAACREFLRRQSVRFRASGPPSAGPGIAPSADPALRAGESLVQALFSHNEFLMIR